VEQQKARIEDAELEREEKVKREAQEGEVEGDALLDSPGEEEESADYNNEEFEDR
jgi:hypothetical protein